VNWKECDSKLSRSEVGILLEGLTKTTTNVGHDDSKLSRSEVGILLEGLTKTTTHVGHDS
jgi:hypothetical protein